MYWMKRIGTVCLQSGKVMEVCDQYVHRHSVCVIRIKNFIMFFFLLTAPFLSQELNK